MSEYCALKLRKLDSHTLMDTRDTPEQAELRRSARQLARELGPSTVADLDDVTRAKRLAGAVRDAGWLELRADDGNGQPLASGVEAAIVAEALGNRVERVYDCGVAGLHRLLDHVSLLGEANAIVAVAGMEGSLPSVVAGLIDRPVIAVPTSVGYGTSFNGLAALLAMLNSCAAGVSVVNIDNGFGAAHQASQINHLAAKIR